MTDTNPQPSVEERVARHLASKDWLTTPDRWDTASAWFRADYLAHAREVIAIVQPDAPAPAPADRAAIRAAALREAADYVGNDDDCECGGCDTCLPRKLAAELRRRADAASAEHHTVGGVLHLCHADDHYCPPASGPGGVADETQQDETQAQPPRHRWAVETRDGVADEWAPGTRFLNRQHAVERYEALAKSHPTWRDGMPVERRLVRETVTYTVEQPAVVSQPDGEAATGCSARPCNPAADELCDTHARIRYHAEGEHAFCDPDCTA